VCGRGWRAATPRPQAPSFLCVVTAAPSPALRVSHSPPTPFSRTPVRGRARRRLFFFRRHGGTPGVHASLPPSSPLPSAAAQPAGALSPQCSALCPSRPWSYAEHAQRSQPSPGARQRPGGGRGEARARLTQNRGSGRTDAQRSGGSGDAGARHERQGDGGSREKKHVKGCRARTRTHFILFSLGAAQGRVFHFRKNRWGGRACGGGATRKKKGGSP